MAHAELASENITPHRLIKSALDEDGINQLIQHVPGWSLREEEGIIQLTRSFMFKDFAQALRFTNRIGDLAEKENHHPAIMTEWGKVTIIWWTHSVKGLHRNDFIMAARCDSAYSSA